MSDLVIRVSFWHVRALVQILLSMTRRANQCTLVQPLLQKYSGFPKPQISLSALSSRPKRGAFRERHERGAGCGGRGRCF
jgi:hypothetical protein